MTQREENTEAIHIIETALTSAGKKIVNYFFWLIFAGLLGQTAYQIADGALDKDATDGYERSGLQLRTDHGTGCQYLETSRGSITPRLDSAGKHAECEESI